MARARWYQIKEVAELARVSVRALHHYDELGLLVPKQRTEAGYRLYDDEDLLRLQQIVLSRELGLSLEDIRRSLDEPGFDRRRLLMAQRAELMKRAEQTAAMVRAVNAALARLEGQETDMSEIFEGFEPSRYEAEAEQRWGQTEAFRESRRRTQRFTQEDWQELAAEQQAIYAELHRLLVAGTPPTAAPSCAAAERHRLSIHRWFYPCDHEMHSKLAGLYEQDARFAQNIDKYGAGLTPFLVAAIRENAKNRGISPT
ncbi:MAG: MerR family transcriptional regulator [Myxococcales bacterium]|nr:MAG: MerR family transcriptional regulator [Myxococcales bacterium]